MNARRVGRTADRIHASTTVTFDGDLDLIAIEKAMNSEPVDLTLPEKIHAARLLATRGYDNAAIGRRIRSDRSTVAGWRTNGWAPPSASPDPEPIDIGNARHGRSGYSKGCRCRTCKDGAAAAKRAAKARLQTN